MRTSKTAIAEAPAEADKSVLRAMEIYRSELRAKLEPEFNSQYVAIHPDSHDYLVEKRPGKAFRAMEAKHRTGPS